MTVKRMHPPDEQILAHQASPEPSRLGQATGDFWHYIPHIEPTLVALLRGLNSPDDPEERVRAVQGLLFAFPSVDRALARALAEIESNELKVRLAAIGRTIIILANALAAFSGIQPDESSTTGKQPDPVMEDLMVHAGRWVAWTRDRQRVVAVADSFSDVVKEALAAGEPDPYVKKAPGALRKTARKSFALLEDESSNILDDIRKVFPDPDAWLDAPNDLLGGEKPRDLISTEREQEVRYLLRGIEDGITT